MASAWSIFTDLEQVSLSLFSWCSIYCSQPLLPHLNCSKHPLKIHSALILPPALPFRTHFFLPLPVSLFPKPLLADLCAFPGRSVLILLINTIHAGSQGAGGVIETPPGATQCSKPFVWIKEFSLLVAILWDKYYYSSHFSDGETKAQRGEVVCSRTHTAASWSSVSTLAVLLLTVMNFQGLAVSALCPPVNAQRFKNEPDRGASVA